MEATQTPGVSRIASSFIEFALREKTFLIILSLGFFMAGVTYQVPIAAAWTGFIFASYSAIANDSIQTIGTFITSNRKAPWWLLWLFMGGIFLATMTYSWWVFGGDVSYQRLSTKGFESAPSQFSYLQVAAPLFLLILTRLRMPVSTTFLLLTSFSTSASGILSVLAKSLTGYVLAFTVAIIIWMSLSAVMERIFVDAEAHPAWRIGQWVISGALWSVWLMQDAANIAVYLPRSLSTSEYLVFAMVIFAGLGLLFGMGGEKVQEVVDEKSNVVDVRAATVIDLVYALILYYFKFQSKVPMSTTWVFIGLLGGRELAMSLRDVSTRTWQNSMRLIAKDLAYVTIGLVISVALALAVNESFRTSLIQG